MSKELKETVYTTPQYQCPRKLYIDDPDKKGLDFFTAPVVQQLMLHPQKKENTGKRKVKKSKKHIILLTKKC